jgi:hypothetical protein
MTANTDEDEMRRVRKRNQNRIAQMVSRQRKEEEMKRVSRRAGE